MISFLKLLEATLWASPSENQLDSHSYSGEREGNITSDLQKWLLEDSYKEGLVDIMRHGRIEKAITIQSDTSYVSQIPDFEVADRCATLECRSKR